ncbi:MAG: signal peptidase I [Candidatus Harrisonbacteria bacterium CG10_big_fil_rev_8_21_14_0_10_42_17]|uniref:Signal peptidase I n=1 Tax=Candidatus Harrisonbacteria bacterium CG10_big_fil_rev_8_21_14_0_10_42_17 TaxID=1974584 RepID=A0A2M6WJ72_9BACT|nr:MAG: signal peptidase I [Candidatus Harrisonbacteria bacterium CG10_big_fil_rev_8_21_14_0_10_42_17]
MGGQKVIPERYTCEKRKKADRKVKRITLYIFLLSLIVVTVIPHFIATYHINGGSMEPYISNGDRVLAATEPTYKIIGLNRGDVIIFKHNHRRFIKRITGLPDEWVRIKEDKTIQLLPDEYFVMGDNRALSLDSRSFGPIKAKDILARVLMVIEEGE